METQQILIRCVGSCLWILFYSIKKHQLKAISASSVINSKVFFICKGLIWLQSSSCRSRGPTLAPFSLGRPAFHSWTRLPAGHDSPHLSRAHRSQTPLTQHAPYSLLAVTTRDSSCTKGGKNNCKQGWDRKGIALYLRRRAAGEKITDI